MTSIDVEGMYDYNHFDTEVENSFLFFHKK